ncbi:MAG: tRNA (N(6)-L-threonylcarbamoyladenosine(37)-C(2))-methylthiotransferase MtaB [Suipraeoptans sp.]
MKKVALHNLGCKVNAYETQAMEESLRTAGFDIIPFGEEADIYIINTCTVTNIADRKSRQMLHRARKKNPSAIVVAAGCYVETSKQEIDPVIDIVVGNNKKHEIVNIINDYIEKSTGDVLNVKTDITKEPVYEEMSLGTSTDHVRANIKVQDGCNQFCSYCIIPYARGRIRSREIENVVSETEKLAKSGYKEVVLTGIHLSSYGKDINNNLLNLIVEINKIDGINRIRLGSLEPRIITEDFLRIIAKTDKFCPHFHLSLQSGCDETLKRMNRHYTSKEYMESCKNIRTFFNKPAITTDIIVGFPGETQEEFEQSYDFVKRVGFYETHVFKFSKREGTKAASMDNQISEHIKSERSNLFLKLNEDSRKDFEEALIGTHQEVLIEEKVVRKGEEFFVGHTKEYVKVGIKSDKNIINKIIDVNIMNYLQIFH